MAAQAQQQTQRRLERRQMMSGIRKRLGLTQEEAACRVGISASHWVQLEAGTRNPSLPVAFKIVELARAAGLNATVEKLFSLHQCTERCQAPLSEEGEGVD